MLRRKAQRMSLCVLGLSLSGRLGLQDLWLARVERIAQRAAAWDGMDTPGTGNRPDLARIRLSPALQNALSNWGTVIERPG